MRVAAAVSDKPTANPAGSSDGQGADSATPLADALLPGAMRGDAPGAVKSDHSITLGAFLHLLGDTGKASADGLMSSTSRPDFAQAVALSALQAQASAGASAALTSLSSSLGSSPVLAATPSNSTPLALQSGWQEALGSRVDWMLNHGVQEARIELHPRDLGSIQIHVRLGAEGAQVQFAATHAEVRHALEASLPKLREMLASDGVALSQAQVGSQFQQPGSQTRSFANALPTMLRRDDDRDGAAQPAVGPTAARVRVASVSLVDDYA
jgi:flagellar hook-length control protein FliK